MEKIKVLLVGMDNICRSAIAEGAFCKLLQDQGLVHIVTADSAGTHVLYAGEQVDPYIQSLVRHRDIDLSEVRGRRFEGEDFNDFDYLLAMDQSSFKHMRALDPEDGTTEFYLLLDFSRQSIEKELPEPCADGNKSLERLLEMILDACEGLLQHIRRQHHL